MITFGKRHLPAPAAGLLGSCARPSPDDGRLRARVPALLLLFLVPVALLGQSTGLFAAGVAEVSSDPAQLEDHAAVAGMFLVARRELQDPFFGHTVIVLLNHDDDGTQGLVVNRKLDVPLSHALPEYDRALDVDEHGVFFGGPLSIGQLFLLTRSPPPDTAAHPIAENLYFSNDRRTLEALLDQGASEQELHLYLGYTGWAPGQLAKEILLGNWYLVTQDPAAIFGPSTQKLWGRLIDELDPPGIEVRSGPETTGGRNALTERDRRTLAYKPLLNLKAGNFGFRSANIVARMQGSDR